MANEGEEMPTLRFLMVAMVLLAGAEHALAQSTPAPAQSVELYELVLKDGSRAYGTIERETDAEVVLRTQSGDTVTARRENIASLRLVKGRIERGEFMRPDLHRTRLFFAPTGRSLKRGEASFGVFQFIAPFVQVGVTDRISVGGGTPLLFGIDEWNRPFWVTPKVQVVRTEKAQAAVGLLHVFDVDGDNAGIAYGVSTFGDNDNAATVGAGLAYADDDRGWVVMGGAEGRLTRNLKVITENYVWKGGDGIVSGGVRFFGERLSADLALAIPIGVGDFIAFPVVNFAYVF
jgi:hypothetical protein